MSPVGLFLLLSLLLLDVGASVALTAPDETRSVAHHHLLTSSSSMGEVLLGLEIIGELSLAVIVESLPSS